MKKILVVMTDGSSTQGSKDPSQAVDELRRSGIEGVVVGIGDKLNVKLLNKMARGLYFSALDFDRFINKKFIQIISGQTCAP